MIIPDINLLLYAYMEGTPLHEPSKKWLSEILNGRQTVGIPWIVSHGFIRIITNPRILELPISPELALSHVRSWQALSHVLIPEPGPRHLDILGELLEEAGTAGKITSDAVLAAVTIEHQARLFSNDSDFSRFSGLKWQNPLAGR